MMVRLSVCESNFSRLCTLAFEVPLATNVGRSTKVCVICSWELFGANGFSQNSKPCSYLGAHLLEKCTFSGCYRVARASVPTQTSSTEPI